MGAFHAHPLGQLAHLAVAEKQLLLQIGALELLAGLAQRQCQQVLLHQRLIESGLDRELALDLLEPDLLARAEHEDPLHEVPQLTQIPRPGIISQPVLRRHAEAPQRQMLIVDQPVDVVAQQVGHILGVIAQAAAPAA